MSKVKVQSNRRKQSRNMTIMTYCPESHIDTVLNTHSDLIRAYAYILHDKFTAEELGDKDHKEPHFHIVLRLSVPLTELTVSNWFTYYNDDGLKQRVTCILTYDVYESFDYLTHKHYPDKFQFLPTDVKLSDIKYFTRESDRLSDDNAINALDDMLAGVPIYTLCRRYGRDFIYHLSQLEYAKFKIEHPQESIQSYYTSHEDNIPF